MAESAITKTDLALLRGSRAAIAAGGATLVAAICVNTGLLDATQAMAGQPFLTAVFMGADKFLRVRLAERAEVEVIPVDDPTVPSAPRPARTRKPKPDPVEGIEPTN